MDGSSPELSAYRFSRALEAWNASELMLKESLYHACVHHAYGTIFHSMRSVLALRGFTPSENTEVFSCFCNYFMKAEELGKDADKTILNALRLREKADFEDFCDISRQEAEEQLADAGVFLDMVGKYLKKKDIL